MVETWTSGDLISVVTDSMTTLVNFRNYKRDFLDVNEETKDNDNAQLLSYVISSIILILSIVFIWCFRPGLICWEKGINSYCAFPGLDCKGVNSWGGRGGGRSLNFLEICNIIYNKLRLLTDSRARAPFFLEWTFPHARWAVLVAVLQTRLDSYCGSPYVVGVL
jgi:hypothetical protein